MLIQDSTSRLYKDQKQCCCSSNHPEACLQESIVHIVGGKLGLLFLTMFFCCMYCVDVPVISAEVWEVVCSKQLYFHWYVEQLHVNLISESVVYCILSRENQQGHTVCRGSVLSWFKK